MADKIRTQGEFDHPAMVWSMVDWSNSEAVDQKIQEDGLWNNEYLESPEGRERLHAAYDSNILELDTPAPDGIHVFEINYDAPDEVFYGVVVEDGKFNPVLTAHAIHIAMATKKTGEDLHHRFIERVEWTPSEMFRYGGYFIVGLGS